MKKSFIPADVPQEQQDIFAANYSAITKNTDRLFIFSCDHKVEHLNNEFHGKGIHPDALNPEHLFAIAQQGTVGAMATHPSFIARYGAQYKDVNYIAKLNGKTNLVSAKKQDPLSAPLWNVHDVVTFAKESGLKIRGVGMTIYLGSAHEAEMLSFAAQSIFEAHQHGLVAIIWAYPRGSEIKQEQDPHLLAGAAGLANALGADFVKIKQPQAKKDVDNNKILKVITHCAGNTKVLCAGGSRVDQHAFLHELYEQIHTGGTSGCAVGRNIFQRSRQEAIALSQAIAAIVYDNAKPKDAVELHKSLMLFAF
jgi:fructose-bisphosphate aldolase/6-deoxy-5-ketofructose 1-phosphate synthase